jgi:hypothetical protein
MDTGYSRPGGEPVTTEAAGQPKPGAPAVQAVSTTHRPYPPSWIDRLTEWVRRLPLPAWIVYLGVGLVLTLLYIATLLPSALWSSGTLSLTTAVLYSFLNGMTCAYIPGLIHYLDDAAGAALDRFRPVMTADEDEYNQLCYQLTTLPARPVWIATWLGVIYTFVARLLITVTAPTSNAAAGSPVVLVMIEVFDIMIYVLVAVTVYHTLHQLRMVNTIYTKHTRINLFQLGPLYSLSGLTARTAIGIGIPTYLWFQANSSVMPGVDTSNVIRTAFLSIMIIGTFIWPLLGAHSLLEKEKQRLADDVAGRIETTIATLHHLADSGKLDDYGPLKGVLDGLLTEQGVIQKLRTWPWRTETVSSLGLAFLLPIIIWVVQRVLERIGL